MHTYDPADRILYVRMTREIDPYATPLESGRTCRRLPAGYANQSQRTYLKGDRMQLRAALMRQADQAVSVSVTESIAAHTTAPQRFLDTAVHSGPSSGLAKAFQR